MVEGIWRELWPLIVLAHLPELLAALGTVGLLALGAWWGVKRKHWRARH